MIRDSGEKVCLAGPDIFCNVSLKSWESVVGGKVEWSVSEELEYNRKREKKKKTEARVWEDKRKWWEVGFLSACFSSQRSKIR